MTRTIEGITWFFPCYNEVDNIEPLVSEALVTFRELGCPFRLVVVNDCSTDGTPEIVTALVHRYPDEVSLVNHAVNGGYSKALYSGFAFGLSQPYPWIGFCDGDRQFNIGEVKKFITAAASDQAKIIVGYRQKRADGLLRLITGRTWHYSNRSILGVNIRDMDCGFKVFHRDVIECVLPQIIGQQATISPEILARAQTLFGFTDIIEIGVEHLPRTAGQQTGVKLKTVLGSLASLVKVRADIKRRQADGTNPQYLKTSTTSESLEPHVYIN